MDLVEIVDALAVAFHDFRGNADRRAVVGDLVQNDRSGGDLRVVSDAERTEDLRACADHHVVAEGRVALADVRAGTAERDALINRAVVSDLGGLSDHDARAVVDEQSFSDGRTGVDLDARQKFGDLADRARGQNEALSFKEVREPVRRDRVEARIEKGDLEIALGGGVAQTDLLDVVSEKLDPFAEFVRKGLFVFRFA